MLAGVAERHDAQLSPKTRKRPENVRRKRPDNLSPKTSRQRSPAAVRAAKLTRRERKRSVCLRVFGRLRCMRSLGIVSIRNDNHPCVPESVPPGWSVTRGRACNPVRGPVITRRVVAQRLGLTLGRFRCSGRKTLASYRKLYVCFSPVLLPPAAPTRTGASPVLGCL